MTSVTRHIPYILREPAIALIGERCYTILVYDFDITHTECLKYALSKGLGFGIVIGGGIVKIPQVKYHLMSETSPDQQIITILRTRSARGLSLSAYVSLQAGPRVC